MFTAETQYASTLKIIDERIASQQAILTSAARKSSDPLVQAAARTMDSLVNLKEDVIAAWKGQADGS